MWECANSCAECIYTDLLYTGAIRWGQFSFFYKLVCITLLALRLFSSLAFEDHFYPECVFHLLQVSYCYKLMLKYAQLWQIWRNWFGCKLFHPGYVGSIFLIVKVSLQAVGVTKAIQLAIANHRVFNDFQASKMQMLQELKVKILGLF